MRIGLNLLYLLPGVVGGTETYAAELLRGLDRAGGDHEFEVFVNRESAEWPIPAAPRFRRVICPVTAVNRGRRYLFEQFRLPGLLKRRSIDVVHSLGYVGPLRTPCPAVVTVPDLNYLALKASLPKGKRMVLRMFSTTAARRAREVITISRFSKDSICGELNIPSQKVSVIYLGPRTATAAPLPSREAEALRRAYGLDRPYLSAIGGGAVHKNIVRLVKVFGVVNVSGSYVLGLIGHLPREAKCEAKKRDDVVVTGFVPDGHLLALMSGAAAFVMPSLYEGFGLPVLEAQQAGVPVICSAAASLPEVAGEGAEYFDPYSVPDMAEKIAMVLSSEAVREDLRRKGRANLQRFSWDRAARETLDVYGRAMALP